MSSETVYAVGFYPWKKKILRAFRPGEKVVFRRSPDKLPRGKALDVATWGVLFGDDAFPPGSRITRYEDGFIRSKGLGAKFTPAMSWVADRRGMYYDATKPSDLEVLLQQCRFSGELLHRARLLRENIVSGGLTKYNLAGSAWPRPSHPGKLILVAGQVESDASIRLGSFGIRTNMGLLQRVRRENPSDYIVYKPHPDVVAGVRREGAHEADAAKHCDSVVTSASMHQLMAMADQVHVNTSLAGFEALLRGKRVVTHGQPFYAGWGLTEDRHEPSRRTSRLTIDELVAGALIQYPLYRSGMTGRVCAAEDVVRELALGGGRSQPGLIELVLGKLCESRIWHRFFAN